MPDEGKTVSWEDMLLSEEQLRDVFRDGNFPHYRIESLRNHLTALNALKAEAEQRAEDYRRRLVEAEKACRIRWADEALPCCPVCDRCQTAHEGPITHAPDCQFHGLYR